MGKVKTEDTILTEEKVSEKTQTKKTPEPKISLDSFISLKGLAWYVKARLDYYVHTEGLKDEMTLKQWEGILKKI